MSETTELTISLPKMLTLAKRTVQNPKYACF